MRLLRDPISWLVALALAGMVACATLGLDLPALARIHDLDLVAPVGAEAPRGWAAGYFEPWNWLNEWGVLPGFAMAVIGLVGWIALARRPGMESWRRSAQMMLLVPMLSAGAVTHTVKQTWGRPRPREVLELGGSLVYRDWWSPAGWDSGKSFPSGDASMAFALVALAFLPLVWPRRWLRTALLVAALTYGGLVGYARMTRGGHFPSDVLGAAVVVLAVLAGVRRWIGAGGAAGLEVTAAQGRETDR